MRVWLLLRISVIPKMACLKWTKCVSKSPSLEKIPKKKIRCKSSSEKHPTSETLHASQIANKTIITSTYQLHFIAHDHLKQASQKTMRFPFFHMRLNLSNIEQLFPCILLLPHRNFPSCHFPLPLILDHVAFLSLFF